MRKAICLFAFGLILFAASTAASAQSSNPIVQGGVQGIELCPQLICDFALFTGLFQGQLGGNPNAVGFITAAMTHTDLPTAGDPPAAITGGKWELRTLTGRVRGNVVGGSITFLPNDLFAIRILLDLQPPTGVGFVGFEGILSHQTLIPRFGGNLVQLPLP
jgi:hypothetical protein